MNSRNDVKTNVLAELAEHLRDFSDTEYQRRVWLRGEGPEVDCFADATTNFMSGCEIDEVMDLRWAEWELPPEPLPSLREFSEALRRFVDQWGADPEMASVLVDPEWATVCRLAERVLSEFRQRGLTK